MFKRFSQQLIKSHKLQLFADKFPKYGKKSKLHATLRGVNIRVRFQNICVTVTYIPRNVCKSWHFGGSASALHRSTHRSLAKCADGFTGTLPS